VKQDIPWKVACRLRDERVGGWDGLDLHHMRSKGNKMIKAMHDMVSYQLRTRTHSKTSSKTDELSSSQSSSGPEKLEKD
jgi:hypothetical protein